MPRARTARKPKERRKPALVDVFEEVRNPAKELQLDLFQDMRSGKSCECPVCNQHCKIYKRKLNKSMAMAILWLVRTSGSLLEWVNVTELGPKWLHTTRPLPTLIHWDLIEGKKNEDASKRTSGIWRPTPKGRAFVYKEITVPKYVFLYNNTLLRMSEERTDIETALGDKFDYSELMEGFSDT